MKAIVVYRQISKGEDADPNSYCVFGWSKPDVKRLGLEDDGGFDYDWESYSEYAFWCFAQSYYKSADCLYEKFKEFKGDRATLDSIGVTICFLYRHYVELFLKYLFVAYEHPSEQEIKSFLDNRHNLLKLWNKLKMPLKQKAEKYLCLSYVNKVEKFVEDIDCFDKYSLKMRYPISKRDLFPTSERVRLDIVNLHQKMSELHDAFERIDNDLPKHELREVSQDRIDVFLKHYSELKSRIRSFLRDLESVIHTESRTVTCQCPLDGIIKKLSQPKSSPFDNLSVDELILLDSLYYTGEAIYKGSLEMPTNHGQAKIDAVKKCILNMERDNLEFGKTTSHNINVHTKRHELIIQNVSMAMSVLEKENE